MSDNRNTIDEGDLVQRDTLLPKGLPILGLSGKYQVKEGFCAVITEGGVFKETLMPGFHHLHKYSLFRDAHATVVDMRTKILNIRTERKYQIISPAPVQIDMDLSVEYKVHDPRRVALEYQEPLHILFDRVDEEIGSIISQSSYEEILLQRNAIASKIFDKIKAKRLHQTLGIEVLKVTIAKFQALDPGEDRIGTMAIEEMERIRRALENAMIIANTPRDLASLIMQAPPAYQMKLLEKMIDVGWGTPEANALLQPYNPAGYTNPPGFGSMNFPQFPGYGAGMQQLNPGMGIGNAYPQNSYPQIGLPGQQQSVQPGVSQNRIVDEFNMLQSIQGATVQSKPAKDGSGNYVFEVTVRRSSGGTLIIVFSCGTQYPTIPPQMGIEIDGENYYFESSILDNWRGNYLIEVAREIISGIG